MPATSYQRLLVHRCSAYYKLAPETEPISKTISVLPTLDSRMFVYFLAVLDERHTHAGRLVALFVA